MLSATERQQREEQIIALRQQGFTLQEISEMLMLNLGSLGVMHRRLVAEGKLQRTWHRQACTKALSKQRIETITVLKKQRATLEKIGDVLTVTRERARQLINKLEAKEGSVVFTPNELLLTSAEAAAEVGVSQQTVSILCAKGEIPCRRRGNHSRSDYILDHAGLEALKQYVTGTCCVCGTKFTYDKKRRLAKTCSKKCQNQRITQRRQGDVAPEEDLDSLQGWHRELWLKLQKHTIPPDEHWLRWKEALEKSGISVTQLWYLRRRKILFMQPHPTIQWDEKPLMMYAGSEVELVREVYSAWLAQTNST